MKIDRHVNLVFVFVLLAFTALPVSLQAATGVEPYVTFRKWTTNDAFASDVATHVAITIPQNQAAADITLASEGRLVGSNKKLYKIKAK